MGDWQSFPANYCAKEVQAILKAVRVGECVSLVGLSGSGKSNLIGFLAEKKASSLEDLALIRIDCNRMESPNLPAFYRLLLVALGAQPQDSPASLEQVYAALEVWWRDHPGKLCLLIDRFDRLGDLLSSGLYNHLRSLRDAYKYRLTYVIATRQPIPTDNELAELFYGDTLWLGPLAETDARWSVNRFAERLGLGWDEAFIAEIVKVSGGYAAFLRAVCEAASSGTPLEMQYLLNHPAVLARLEDFWKDCPDANALQRSGLDSNPLLLAVQRKDSPDDLLTAKEKLLYEVLKAHPGIICDKDDLIRAVWPEDQIYTHGLRDDSLAQLIRRLREKIEMDPSHPARIITVPGRGYRFQP